MLKRVQFTSGDTVSERLPLQNHIFPSLSSLSKSGVVCPVCKQSRSKFFCSGCIRNGDFTHSTVNVLERFAEKKLKFIALKGQQNQMENELKERHENIVKKEKLLLKIRQCENSIALLKRMLKQKSQRLEETNNSVDEAKRKVLKSHDKQIKLKKGVAEVKNIIARQNVKISERSQECLVVENDLQAIIRLRIVALTTFIFKIQQRDNPLLSEQTLQPHNSSTKDSIAGSAVNLSSGIMNKNDDDEEEDTPLLLISDTSSGSSSTTVVKCISNPSASHRNNDETLYFSIGEPWLASNEDFKIYCKFVIYFSYL